MMKHLRGGILLLLLVLAAPPAWAQTEGSFTTLRLGTAPNRARDSVGLGSPEGVVAGGVGDRYVQVNGLADNIVWTKESGAGTTTGWKISAAPKGATYLLQTANSLLPNAQVMGVLGTGLVRNTTTTGVQSIFGGTSCTNQFPRALDASGAATCETVSLTADVAGTLPIGGGGTGNTSGAATLSAITNDTTTNATMYPVWAAASSGTQAMKVSSSRLAFNPAGAFGGGGALAINGAPTAFALDVQNPNFAQLHLRSTDIGSTVALEMETATAGNLFQIFGSGGGATSQTDFYSGGSLIARWKTTVVSPCCSKSIQFFGDGSAEYSLINGNTTIGVAGKQVGITRLLLAAGSAAANTAPLNFSSGPLLTAPEAGSLEFLTDKFYGTITTGTARKTFAFLESPALVTPDIGVATGTRLTLTDSSNSTTAVHVENTSAGGNAYAAVELKNNNALSYSLGVGGSGTPTGFKDRLFVYPPVGLGPSFALDNALNAYIGGDTSTAPTLTVNSGYAAIGTTPDTAALLTFRLGTTARAPLKFTSGALLTTPSAGAVEFLTDAFYGTISTGPARKTFAFLESPVFTTQISSPLVDIPYASSTAKTALSLRNTTTVTNQIRDLYVGSDHFGTFLSNAAFDDVNYKEYIYFYRNTGGGDGSISLAAKNTFQFLVHPTDDFSGYYAEPITISSSLGVLSGIQFKETNALTYGAGTNTYNVMTIRPVINTTGGTNTIRGAYYNPTLTSLTGTTHIAWENATGNMLFGTTSGKVGVGAGATSPSAQLDVTAITEQLRLRYDASNYTKFTENSAGRLTVENFGTNSFMRLQDTGDGLGDAAYLTVQEGTAGNGGIVSVGNAAGGTTGSRLSVQTNVGAAAGIALSTSDGTRKFNILNFTDVSGTGIAGTLLYTPSNHPLAFGTNNSNAQVLLTTSGKLGIGTIAPGSALTVNGGVALATTTTGAGDLVLSNAVPTISSAFGASPSVTAGHVVAFRVNVGTGGLATGGVLATGATATTGWNCHVENLTALAANRADQRTVQTASTTTTVTVQNQTVSTGAALAWTASDILTLICVGF